jgi:hypothetical protein
MKINTCVKAGGRSIQHNQGGLPMKSTAACPATGLKLKTSLKVGFKACTRNCESDSNHNQTVRLVATGLKLKTSLKAGYKTCTRNCDSDANHNQTARPVATSLKLKTSLKAGFKACSTRNAECGDSNHNQTSAR